MRGGIPELPLLDQECDQWDTWLEEEELCPMIISIECKPRPCKPNLMHCPHHCQVGQLIITGIKYHRGTQFYFLIKDTYSIQ